MKTLKDFSIRTSGAYYPELIREEAIKWIKYYQKDIDVLEKNRKERCTQIKDIVQECFEEKVSWIKHFFNITKEELK